jgi:mannose-6-phosphate isomerase-like protein (cupin superfamily)
MLDMDSGSSILKHDVRARPPGSYEQYMLDEGIPIHEALVGIADVMELNREPWNRTGGRGAFVQMLSTYQAEKGMYVIEIPPGGELKPERHLYEELMWVLSGNGVAQVWQDGMKPHIFEWQEGSMFAPPLNTWHRLFNGSNKPALLFGVTTAPRIMNTLHDSELVFNCDHRFPDAYNGEEDFFTKTNNYQEGRLAVWETNFILDAKGLKLDAKGPKGWGSRAVRYKMNKHWPNGHISEWPVGVYHEAHRHRAGAILHGLNSHGYVLAWPHELGSRPYEAGHGDRVLRVPWGPNAVYTPPDNWYHQHFNTGSVPARHIALHSGLNRSVPRKVGNVEDFVVFVSERDGGVLIRYEDEDPQIRWDFVAELARNNVQCVMPSPEEIRSNTAKRATTD